MTALTDKLPSHTSFRAIHLSDTSPCHKPVQLDSGKRLVSDMRAWGGASDTGNRLLMRTQNVKKKISHYNSMTNPSLSHFNHDFLQLKQTLITISLLAPLAPFSFFPAFPLFSSVSFSILLSCELRQGCCCSRDFSFIPAPHMGGERQGGLEQDKLLDWSGKEPV